MTDNYQIRVSSRLGPTLSSVFAGMRVEVVPRQTVIQAWLSTDELRELLLRMERTGGQLIHLDRAAGKHRQDPEA